MTLPRPRRIHWLLAGAALASPCAARAGDALTTDRPDFVESSEVVGPGRVQIETGVVFERNKADGLKTHTRTTPSLLRIGVSESVELRVETDGFARSSSRELASGATTRENGFSDVALGVKWRMQDGDEDKGTPGVAWLVHVDVDSGSAAFRGQGVRPSLRVVAEWDLPLGLSIGVMPGVVFDRNAEGRRFAAGILAVTLAKDWTPAWHTFVEVAGQTLASKKNGGSVVTFDAGVAYVVTHDLQVDLSMARGLSRYAPDLQWGVGLSIRF